MKFLFIGGCGRSGTTLLQKLLCAHSKINGHTEYDNTFRIMQLYKKMLSPNNNHFYDQNNLKKNIVSFYKSTLQNLWTRDINFISEKTPINFAVADTLLELFSDSYYINMIRDGRDVFLSHKNVKKRARAQAKKYPLDQWGTLGLCNTWNFSIDTFWALKTSTPHSDRIINVRYEDLVNHPQDTLTALLKSIGLNYEECLNHPEKIQHHQASIDQIWYTPEMFAQKFNPTKIQGWKKNLNLSSKFIANLILAPNLKKMGYSVQPFYLKLNQMLPQKTLSLINALIFKVFKRDFTKNVYSHYFNSY